MSVLSQQLAQALNSLSFVQAIEDEQSGNGLNILCRLKPNSESLWATLAEAVLREGARRANRPEYWHAHIARVYMLRDERLVYGWVFVIQSNDIAKSMQVLLELISNFGKALSAPARPQQNDDDYDAPEAIVEDEDYSEPETPMPKGYVPEADERGNPIVPREHRVKSIQMAGLPKNYDRNAPDPETAKGGWTLEGKKKGFRPPVPRR